MYSRIGPILGALLADGPGADADLKAFMDTIETERRVGNTSIVEHIDAKFGLPAQLSAEGAVDILWVATSFDLADRLVRRCGWSLDAYEQWVAEIVITSLTRERWNLLWSIHPPSRNCWRTTSRWPKNCPIPTVVIRVTLEGTAGHQA